MSREQRKTGERRADIGSEARASCSWRAVSSRRDEALRRGETKRYVEARRSVTSRRDEALRRGACLTPEGCQTRGGTGGGVRGAAARVRRRRQTRGGK
ncbi:MAG: hypothetical protein LBK25_07325 [Treponema sp.]|nr:hypothetical protein [Treponema sp.]